MRVLITGGAGFCGKHLTRLLDLHGIEVHTLGTRTGLTEKHHFGSPKDPHTIQECISAVRPTQVFHLAGVAKTQEILDFYTYNIAYASILLEALSLARLDNTPVLLVGTSAEYGKVEKHQLPIDEQITPRPHNHYGLSKLSQTLLGISLSKTGRNIVVVRPFNIIGPGMPNHLVVQSFVNQLVDIREGRQPPIINVGNLKSSRDFIHVKDVSQAYYELLNTPEAYGHVINVCTGNPVRIELILERLIALTGLSVEVHQDPECIKKDDILDHFGSPLTMNTFLGWSPTLNLDETLRDIIDQMKETGDRFK